MKVNSSNINYLSLLLSIFAIAGTGIQTFLQYESVSIQTKSNLQVEQLRACSNIISGVVSYMSNNAELRLTQTNLVADDIQLSDKSDFAQLELSEEEQYSFIEIRKTKAWSIAKELNSLVIGNQHLFPKEVSSKLHELNEAIIFLSNEPEGNEAFGPNKLAGLMLVLSNQCAKIGIQRTYFK